MGLPAGIVRKPLLAAVVCFWLIGNTPRGWAQGSPEPGPASLAGAQALAHGEHSLQKSGQLRDLTDLDDRGTPIRQALPLEDRPAEKPVSTPPASAPAPVASSLPAEVLALDSSMAARVNDVLACRLEIATDRRVRLNQVAAGAILLRWTVEPGGGVANAEAVAERNTDADVLSCARRKMESWVFIRAPGGEPMHIHQSLKFE